MSQGVCRDSDIETEEIEEGQSSASGEAPASAQLYTAGSDRLRLGRAFM